jgi:hypothetical protein
MLVWALMMTCAGPLVPFPLLAWRNISGKVGLFGLLPLQERMFSRWACEAMRNAQVPACLKPITDETEAFRNRHDDAFNPAVVDGEGDHVMDMLPALYVPPQKH